MSVIVRVHGSNVVVEASDRIILQDSVEITHPSEDHREFLKLVGTVQNPGRVTQLTFNFDDSLNASIRFGKGRIILRPPGSRLRSLADFFLSKKTMKRVVNPILADLQLEYCEALAEGRTAKAFWVCVRGYCTFWKALGLYGVVKNVVQIWKISRLG